LTVQNSQKKPANVASNSSQPQTRFPKEWQRSFLLILAYGAWSWFFRLLSLTWITHGLRDSQARLQDISETFFINELVFAGFGSIAFILLWRSLSPIRHPSYADFLTSYRIEKGFLPGFKSGAILATTLLMVLAVFGFHQVIGFYLDWEESPSVLLGFLIRSASLISLIYCEEFLFRHRILPSFRLQFGDSIAALLSSVLFVGIKNLQFELGLLQSVVLMAVSLHLVRRTFLKGNFANGAGLFAGLLFVIHPLASLPIFGNDYQGLFLIKSQGLEGIEPTASRWISGGAGGPFGSILFLVLLGLITLYLEKPDLFRLPIPKFRTSKT
jgi:hypothetical protein